MSTTIAPVSNPIHITLSEEYSREINRLDPAARIHAIEMILDSLKPTAPQPEPEQEVYRITDLEGMGNGIFGRTKEEIDEYLRKERDSWD